MIDSTAFVGRTAEVRSVLETLDTVETTGEPRALTLAGPAGIGKTRLIDEILLAVPPRVRVFRGLGRPSAAPFGVIEEILKERFGSGDATAVRAAAVDAFGDRQLDEILYFLGKFVGIDFPRSAFLQAFDDESREQIQMGRVVLRRFLEADARRFGLTLLVFEDLHCVPRDTLELIFDLIGTLAEAPVLLVCTGRPELLVRHSGFSEANGHRHSLVEVPPLSDLESGQLIATRLGRATPPAQLVHAAVESAAGNPYLLEQTILAYWETGVLHRDPRGHVAFRLGRLADAKLPLSVGDAIATRVTALGADARQLLEMAATMGSVFWAGALIALGRLHTETPDLWGGVTSAADHIRDTLADLIARDYLVAHETSSVTGDVEYAFRHNVEREALLEQLPTSRAVDYHRVVGEWLEFRLAERAEEHCELLAHHFEEAGQELKAAQYSLRAGDRARARFANAKAAEHYSRGLELLGDSDRLTRLEALHHYGDVLQLAGKNDEALDAFREMLEIAFQLDLRAKGGAAHNRIGRLYRAVGRLDEAMRHLGTGYALFEGADDTRGVASSLDDVGKVHWMRGAYPEAERFMRASLERRQELGDQRSIALSFNNLGLVFQDSGRFEEARVHFQEALVLRRAIDDPPGIAQTLNNLGSVAQDSGDHLRAAELYREALRVAEETGDRMRQAVILTNLGETQYRLDDPNAAIEVLRHASSLAANLGDRILEGEILRGLAKAFLLVGESERARTYIERSVELFESARSPAFLGAALRTQAEVEASDGPRYQAARDAFERSVAVLEQVGSGPELAATCRAFADFLERDQPQSEATDDDERTDATGAGGRARQLRAQARVIENRLLGTNPRVSTEVAGAFAD